MIAVDLRWITPRAQALNDTLDRLPFCICGKPASLMWPNERGLGTGPMGILAFVLVDFPCSCQVRRARRPVPPSVTKWVHLVHTQQHARFLDQSTRLFDVQCYHGLSAPSFRTFSAHTVNIGHVPLQKCKYDQIYCD